MILASILYSVAFLTALVKTQEDPCLALPSTFSFENTTVLSVTHVTANTNITTPGKCQSSAVTGNNTVCRVFLRTNTSAMSRVMMEAWLPDPDLWNGRFSGAGNGGLGGCIDYSTLAYTTSFGFASIASDNGHDGNAADGSSFLNNPETINDFAFRSIHVEVMVGKALVAAYYGRPQDKSYYVGCSTGGRQGAQTAQLFPEDFDGILAGSPAVDWNHLQSWSEFVAQDNGGKTAVPTPLIGADLWPTVSAEIMRQCDGLDGVLDNTITEPDECIFRPETLLCTPSTNTSTCLNSTQVQALNTIFQPLFGNPGELLFPRYDPGADADGNWQALLSGAFFDFSSGWFTNAVFNDTNLQFNNFNITFVRIADAINPGGVATFPVNLSSFEARGGKFVTYHGRRDQLIASGNSKRLYNSIAQAMSTSSLDSFYRLFLVPGMTHCSGGNGAWNIGQLQQSPTNTSTHNVLLALVDWVENGIAPANITGVDSDGANERVHCRYPVEASVFDGEKFVCAPVGTFAAANGLLTQGA